MKKEYILFIVIFFIGINAFSQEQNLGIPIIKGFSKESYDGGSQNWDVIQDRNGIMYFANSDGMMSFDGTTWEIYPLPNLTIVRSLAISEAGIIYAGGQNEFGRFIPDERGIWKYESLRDLIPLQHRKFEDVWGIEINDEGVFFMASEKLYHLKEDKVNVFVNGTINFLGQSNGKIYIQDFQSGLYEFSQNRLNKVEGSDIFIYNAISTIIDLDNTQLITTIKDGIYKISNTGFEKWKTDADDFLINNHIRNVTTILNNKIAIGSEYGGLIIMNEKGQSIYHLHKGHGLLNNNIISLFSDRRDNLWLSLSNGINYIHTNSPFTRIYPEEDLDGIGFDVKIHKGKIYLATNKGLYYKDWKTYYSPFENTNFKMVNNTKGQVWGLDIVDDQLFVAHHKGALIVEGDEAKLIYDKTGIWNFQKSISQPDKIISGSYNNVSLFEKVNNTWSKTITIPKLEESSRFVEQDKKGNIWVSHPYRGIFKITPSEELDQTQVRLYGENDGLPSAILNHLFKIKDEIIFAGETGVFNFNYETQKFEPYKIFNDFFGNENKVRRLFETPTGDIWFVNKEEFGLVKIKDNGLEKILDKIVFPLFKKQLNRGFESIYPYDENNVFINNDKGFIHYSPFNHVQADTSFQVVLNEVRIISPSDSLITKGIFSENNKIQSIQPKSQIKTFLHQQNNIVFSFSATDFSSLGDLEYRYYLEGLEEDWSDWQDLTLKEYTNLSNGKYAFHIQARNNIKQLSNELIYRFTISPPWYKSSLAYFIYSLLSILGMFFIIRFYQKKYSGLKEDHDKVVKESKATIGKLEAEKKDNEIAFKQRELISTTLNLVKKNETLADIKKKLTEIKKDVSSPDSSKKIQKLIQKLQTEEIQSEHWDQMMLHFNQLNNGFFDRLKNTYPALTPKDLKMCAYLKMNLTTKEMTSLLNVTMRGVEASRYRLRKKFQLEKDQNLTEFLMTF